LLAQWIFSPFVPLPQTLLASSFRRSLFDVFSHSFNLESVSRTFFFLSSPALLGPVFWSYLVETGFFPSPSLRPLSLWASHATGPFAPFYEFVKSSFFPGESAFFISLRPFSAGPFLVEAVRLNLSPPLPSPFIPLLS